MVQSHFKHVDTWVFDLGNTLYHPSARLFDQIEIHMTNYVMDALGVDRDRADYLRGHYWEKYGTTLSGLMREHDLDPLPYLVAVHDIDMSNMSLDPILAANIDALPGRKIIYTNGMAPYATRVLAARGLDGLFDEVYGVEHAGFLPKPERAAFDSIFRQANLNPTTAAMFEDDPRNLRAPFDLGMQTVHVADEPAPDDHIHHHTADLAGFLSQLR